MSTTSIDVKKSLVDALMAGLIALIVFGPVVGVVLKGYDFTPQFDRVAWMVGAVMIGRLLLSLFLQTSRGRVVLEGFERSGGGVGVQPPGYVSRMRWIIPGLILLAIIFPFFANKYLLTVIILGLIYGCSVSV